MWTPPWPTNGPGLLPFSPTDGRRSLLPASDRLLSRITASTAPAWSHARPAGCATLARPSGWPDHGEAVVARCVRRERATAPPAAATPGDPVGQARPPAVAPEAGAVAHHQRRDPRARPGGHPASRRSAAPELGPLEEGEAEPAVLAGRHRRPVDQRVLPAGAHPRSGGETDHLRPPDGGHRRRPHPGPGVPARRRVDGGRAPHPRGGP